MFSCSRVWKVTRRFQDARDFAGADWASQRVEGRARLLQRAGADLRMVRWRWTQLPPSVQTELVKPLLKGGQR